MNHLENITPRRNRWYWYLLVLGLSFIMANVVGSIPLVVLIVATSIQSGENAAVAISKGDITAAGVDSNLYLASMMFVFAVFLFSMIFLVRKIQGRTWPQVVNGTSRVRWRRVLAGIAVWGGLNVLLLAASLIISPEDYEFRFDASQFVWLVIISLVMIPLQTTCEEYCVRGHLAQGIGAWTRNRWAVLAITSVAFGLMHGANPEVDEYGYGIMMAQYISMGVILGLVTLLDDGIEIAMGIHAANNIFASVFITFKGSVLPTAALFMAKDINPVIDFISVVVYGAVAVVIFARLYGWRFGVMNERIALRNYDVPQAE